MENRFEPTDTQKIVLQVLYGLDAVYVAIVIVLAVYNCITFVWRGNVRTNFIVLFYAISFFCLINWEITAIA